MRLTALCVCGTLLVISCLSWTKGHSDEENLEFGGFGPCAATMRPEGPCRQGQDEGTCPYLFSVPPLTFHLPKQLRELENIVEEVQKLKDSVDELRMMCTDCTVRQTDVACAGQTERERGNLIVGMDGYEDERKSLKEGQSEVGPNNFNNSSQINQFKVEHNGKGDDVLKNDIFQEKDNWESEKPSDRLAIKDGRKSQPVLKKEGKAEGGRAKGKEKAKAAAVPTVSESDRIIDVVIRKMVEKQSKRVDMDRRKGKNGKGHSTGDRSDRLETERETKIMKDKIEDSGPPVWQDLTLGAEKRAKTAEERSRDGIRMSKNPDKHTNKEREGLRQERKKEMEKGAKTPERNNKKPKQTESIRGMEKTIKEGVKEDGRQTEKEIKTSAGQMAQSVQRDSVGELALRKVTERTAFASIIPTAYAMTSSPSHSPEDLVEALSLASSSPLPSSHSHLISGISQELTTSAEGKQIERTDLKTAAISEQPGAQENFMTVSSPITTTPATATLSSLNNPGQILSTSVSSVSTTSTNPERSHQLEVTSTVSPATFSTSLESFGLESLQTGQTDHSTANKDLNLMPNKNPGNKLLAHNGSVSSDPPGLKPEGKSNLTKNNHQPGETSLSDQKNNHGPEEKASSHEPVSKETQGPGILTTHQNGNNTMNPQSQDTEHITDPNLVVNDMLEMEKYRKHLTSTQSPLPQETAQVVDARDSGEARLTEILNIARDPASEEKPAYSLDMNISEGSQEIPENLKSEGKFESDENQKNHDHFSTSNKPNKFQEATTELLKTSEKYPTLATKTENYALFGTDFLPDHGPTRLRHQPVKSGYDIPDKKQTSSTSANALHLTTDQQGLTSEHDKLDLEFSSTLQSEQSSVPTTISVLHEIIQTGDDKTFGPFLTQGPLTQPVAKPGATSVRKSEPSLEVVPSLETTTDSTLPGIFRTTSGYLRKAQTDSPPTSGPVKLITGITHSAGGAKFNPREIISLEPNTFGSSPFPQHRALPEGVTMIPNSRVKSDLWPQTATQTPLIQMTTPNGIMLRTLPSNTADRVSGPTEPASIEDASQQGNFPYNLEEARHRKTPDLDKKKFFPTSSPRAQMNSTISSHLSSTKPVVSSPEFIGPEVSTDSTRELRVKINQVAAFFNNSVSSNGRHLDPDRHPKVPLEGKQAGGWPDGKLPSTSQGKIIYFGF